MPPAVVLAFVVASSTYEETSVPPFTEYSFYYTLIGLSIVTLRPWCGVISETSCDGPCIDPAEPSFSSERAIAWSCSKVRRWRLFSIFLKCILVFVAVSIGLVWIIEYMRR